MNRVVIRHQESRKLPFLLQHLLEKKRVLAAEEAVYPVVSAHHRGDMSVLHCGLEHRQVNFAQWTFIDQDLYVRPVLFLIVANIMFSTCPYPFRLDPRNDFGHELAAQKRIFAVHILEISPAQWQPIEVHPRAQDGKISSSTGIPPPRDSDFVGKTSIPGRCER